MAADFGIVMPLWGYAAERGELLERAGGEIGLNHVTVPAVTGPHTEFRLDPDAEQPQFHTNGGWHYPSAKNRCATARQRTGNALRPIRAEWSTQSRALRSPHSGASRSGVDLLARLREHAARLGLGLVLRVDLRSVPALVEQAPHVAQRNAWGQEVLSAGACACNPDLRELLRATLEELRRYEPTGFELVDWLPDDAVDREMPRPLDWQPAARRLLDACFCAACRQIAERAGVDPEQAARSVRVSVVRLVERGNPGMNAGARSLGKAGARSGDAGEAEDPLVESYRATRAADCGQWLRRLADGDGERRYWLAHELERTVPHELATALPRLACVPELPAVDDERLEALLRWAGEETPAGLSMPVWQPTFSAAPRLVRLVSETARAGTRHFDFEGLATALPEALTWVKQAVRFARRG